MRGIFPLNITARAPKLFKGLGNQKKVVKPWGSYTVLATEQDHQIKRIILNPGARLSLQKHIYRSEHWVFTEGIGAVTRIYSLKDFIKRKNWFVINVFKGNHVFIDEEVIHRVENTRKNSPLVFIEVQLGKYFGEEDIIRLEDDYGREGKKDS